MSDNLTEELKQLKQQVVGEAMTKFKQLLQPGNHEFNMVLTRTTGAHMVLECALINAGTAIVVLLGADAVHYLGWVQNNRERLRNSAAERIDMIRYAAAANDMMLDYEQAERLRTGKENLDPAVQAFASGEFLKVEQILSREIARQYLETIK